MLPIILMGFWASSFFVPEPPLPVVTPVVSVPLFSDLQLWIPEPVQPTCPIMLVCKLWRPSLKQPAPTCLAFLVCNIIGQLWQPSQPSPVIVYPVCPVLLVCKLWHASPVPPPVGPFPECKAPSWERCKGYKYCVELVLEVMDGMEHTLIKRYHKGLHVIKDRATDWEEMVAIHNDRVGEPDM